METTAVETHQANPFVRVAQPRGLGRWIPALAALRPYQRAWLLKDIVAGLVLTTILVPVGMGKAGIELGFAEMKYPVKDRLKQYGLFTKLGAHLFFPTLGQAVDAYLEAHAVEWSDGEESAPPG